MNIIPFDKDKHYSAICELWGKYDYIPPNPSFLPKRGLLAVNDAGDIIAALWMYVEPGSVAFVDWGVADPMFEESIKEKAFAKMFDELVREARKENCTFVYGVSANRGYQRLMNTWGMKVVERGLSAYCLPLIEGVSTEFLG